MSHTPFIIYFKNIPFITYFKNTQFLNFYKIAITEEEKELLSAFLTAIQYAIDPFDKEIEALERELEPLRREKESYEKEIKEIKEDLREIGERIREIDERLKIEEDPEVRTSLEKEKEEIEKLFNESERDLAEKEMYYSKCLLECENKEKELKELIRKSVRASDVGFKLLKKVVDKLYKDSYEKMGLDRDDFFGEIYLILQDRIRAYWSPELDPYSFLEDQATWARALYFKERDGRRRLYETREILFSDLERRLEEQYGERVSIEDILPSEWVLEEEISKEIVEDLAKIIRERIEEWASKVAGKFPYFKGLMDALVEAIKGKKEGLPTREFEEHLERALIEKMALEGEEEEYFKLTKEEKERKKRWLKMQLEGEFEEFKKWVREVLHEEVEKKFVDFYKEMVE